MTKRINGFYELCKIGNLPVLIKYVELYNITAEEARSDCNLAFRYACYKGHLHVAQWLVEYFGLTIEDARADNNYAFRLTCSNGHLHVALKKSTYVLFSWIIARFGLTREEMCSHVSEAIVDQLDWEPLGPKLAVKLS